jgi:protein-S-isoprenylcysteine O-methyltransferase Ste14
VTPTQIQITVLVVAALASLGVLTAFRAGARSGHRVARHSQEVTRMGGNLARALLTTAVIVTIQWAVLATTTDPRAWGVALGIPALVTGGVIARMFSVTEIIHDHAPHPRRNGRTHR